MAQGILPFKYETEKKTTGMTALGGLPAYLDLAQFHDEQQEGHRQQGKALIPAANEHLSGFVGINKDLAAFSSFQQWREKEPRPGHRAHRLRQPP